MTEEIDFDVELHEQGDEGSAYRTQNDPSDPFQRVNITERRGALDIRCTHKEVIHGYLKDGVGPASLIVYEFQFDRRKKARRISRVDVEFVYGGGAREPEVLEVAPRGRMSMEPTTQTETITWGGGLQAGVTPTGVAQLGGNYKWEKVTGRETKDATIVVGSPILVKRNYGKSNGASWTLLENESTLTGVPAFFQAAVLLKRADNSPFHSVFTINASVDLFSSLKALVGSKPKDDAVLYDPLLPPTNQLRDYDLENLETVDLQGLGIASFTTPTN